LTVDCEKYSLRGKVMDEKLYDVVIYNCKTGVVDAIVGTKLPEANGTYNANKRLETVLSRINDDYNASIVDTGKYVKGDTIALSDR